MTIGDGCDDYFGSGGGIKNTVTIVTTVTRSKTQPPSPALNPQIGSRTVDGSGAVREYGNAGVHAGGDDAMMWYIVGNGQGSRRSRIPLGEPTILCSRRMKVS